MESPLDLQDGLLLAGVGCLVTGVAMVYVPAALILFGAICLGAVCAIERTKRTPAPESKPARSGKAPPAELPEGIVSRQRSMSMGNRKKRDTNARET